MPQLDLYGNPVGLGSGTSNLETYFDEETAPKDLPDFEVVIKELEGLRNNPNLTIAAVRQIDEVLGAARQGDTSVLTTPIAEQLNPNPVMDVLGKVGGAIWDGVDFAASAARSTLNQFGSGLRAAGLDSGMETFTEQDEFGISGWLAGLTTGSDTVSGKDLFWDKDYQAEGLGDSGVFGEGHSFNIPDWIPVLPDRLPTPDIDTIMGLGAEIATDPLTFVRAPGIINQATGLASTGSVRGGRAGHALKINRMLRGEQYKHLSMDVKNAVQDAVERGGITTLWRQANKSTMEGFDAALLRSLGVQEGLNFAGRTIPHTEKFVDLMGVLQRGPANQKSWARAFDKLGDGLTQSGINNFIKSVDADGLARFTPFEQVGIKDILTRSALVQRQGMGTSADIMAMFAHKYGLADDINEDSLRHALEVADGSVQFGEGLGNQADEFVQAVDDLVLFAAKNDLTVFELVEGLSEFADQFGAEALEASARGAGQPLTQAGAGMRRTPGKAGRARGADPTGLGLAENSRQFRPDGSGASPLARFIADPNNSTTSRILAPGIAWALVNLDSHAARLLPTMDAFESLEPWRYFGASRLKELDPALYKRLAAQQPGLAGSGGVLNRGFGTLRQLWGNVAVIQALDEGAELGSEGLKSSFRRLADEQDVLADVMRTFGVTDLSPSREAIDAFGRELDELTNANNTLLERFQAQAWSGADANAVLENPVDGLVATRFEARMALIRSENLDSLRVGDMVKPLARIDSLITTGQRHLKAIKNLLSDLGDGRAIRVGLERKYDGLNWERAEDMFKSGELQGEVNRIIAETWYNPQLGTQLTGNFDLARVFAHEDRAVLQFAFTRDPEMVTRPLDILSHWIDEWTVTAQKTFTQYSDNFVPEIAEQLRNIDIIFYDELINHSVFGGAVEFVMGNREWTQSHLMSMTKEQLVDLAGTVTDYHFSLPGATDFFGGPTGWADTMLDASKFLNRLQKAQFGDETVDRLFGVLAKGNRTFFRGQAVFGAGFMQRNSAGAFRVNFLNGVRTFGNGGYRQFGDVYNTSRAALRDEAINLMRPRTSSLWKNLDTELLEQAQELAYSGVLVSSSSAGNTLDRAFEAQERSIGGGEDPGLLGRAASANANALSRVQNTIEQPVTSLVQTMTQGPGKPLGRNLAQVTMGNSLDGLQAATRQELESYFRGALAWSVMRKDGGTIGDGMLAVSRNHFDYWDLTSTGQIVDELMPFFLFRGRMTRLTVEMGMSSPGVLSQVQRFRNSQEQRDPLGAAGNLPRYTFGIGGYKGIDLEFDVSDPIDDIGMNNIRSGLNFLSAPGRNLDEFVQRELIDPLTPIIPWQQMLNIAGRGDGYYEDDLEPVAMMDGIPSEVMRQAVKIPLVKNLLEAGGLIDTRDGELVSTPGAMNYFTEILPLLAIVEKVGEGNGYFQGLEEDFGDNPTEAQLKSLEVDQIKRERQMWNVLFGFFGFPFEVISQDQREKVAQDIVMDIIDYDLVIDQLSAVRDRQYTQAAVNQVANPMEEAVAGAAKRAGIDHMYAQVPWNNYRLDYAIPAPDGSILMAVEVDGYTYHSSREQRASDAERQAAIEASGIIVHRVLSRDFRADPDGEGQRLKDAYDEAMRQNALTFTDG